MQYAKVCLAGLMLATLLVGPGVAGAQAEPASHTHRITQVKDRRELQERRILRDEKQHRITGCEARHLLRDEHEIGVEEREMRNLQGHHHLTAADQKALNQDINNVNAQLRRDVHQ